MTGMINQQQAQKASPEQEAIVNKLLKQAVDFLFEEENAVQLVEAAKAQGPVDAIAQFAVQLVTQQYKAADMAGKQLDMAAVALAGREIGKIMAQILVLAQVIKPEQAEQIASEAFQKGIAMHNQSAGQGA
jgi:hypothetical protein